MPVDRGLSSLGLIMQLGGSVFFALMVMEIAAAMLAVAPLLSWHFVPDGDLRILLVIHGAAAVRSALHRHAGGALVYGSRHGRFVPAYIYIGVAIIQSALTLWLLDQRAPLAIEHHMVAALVLLGWPITLLVVLTRPALRRRALRGELFVSEDMGFEGASSIMVLLGVTGALAALFMVHASFQTEGSAWTLVLVGVSALLFARSTLHTVAGIQGLRGVDAAGGIEAAARYVKFGLVAAVLAGAAILIVFAVEKHSGYSDYHFPIAGTATILYVLFCWPLILRRFHRRRHFPALRDGTEGFGSRRAPDAGLTAIGWLLLATAMAQVGLVAAWLVRLPQLGPYHQVSDWLLGLNGGDLAGHGWPGRSCWWILASCAVQLWAAIELIRMSHRHRMAVTIYAAATLAITIRLLWPQVDPLMRVISSGLSDPSVAGGLVQVAFWLGVPVATLILVRSRPSATG